jgi:hypothetical protein
VDAAIGMLQETWINPWRLIVRNPVSRLRLLLALALLIAAFPSRTLSAQGDACSVVTRTDVGIAVGRGAVTPGKLRRYARDPSSECQYDTERATLSSPSIPPTRINSSPAGKRDMPPRFNPFEGSATPRYTTGSTAPC